MSTVVGFAGAVTDTPPRRSDATRAAIRNAARERFAADGYERATIRAIASDAAIDPSMVIRHFGSKEKLSTAAAEFDLQLPEPSSIARAEAGWVLVGHFLDRWEGDDTLLALLRTAVTHAAATERMRAVFADQLAPLVAQLCPDPVQARTRAGLVATQMLGSGRAAMCWDFPPSSNWIATRSWRGSDRPSTGTSPPATRQPDLPTRRTHDAASPRRPAPQGHGLR